jgi:hypothetical protein
MHRFNLICAHCMYCSKSRQGIVEGDAQCVPRWVGRCVVRMAALRIAE